MRRFAPLVASGLTALCLVYGLGCREMWGPSPEQLRTELLSAARCRVAGVVSAGAALRRAPAIDCFVRVPPHGVVALSTEPAGGATSVELSVAHDDLGEVRLEPNGSAAEWSLPGSAWVGEIVSLRLRSSQGGASGYWQAIDLIGEAVVRTGIIGGKFAAQASAKKVLAEGQRSSHADAPGERGAPAVNVILYVVDTLRADRLSLHGFEQETSPAIDRFAQSAFVFDNAYTPGSMTSAAIAPMFVSALRRDVGHLQFDENAPDEQTLTEVLQSAGYRTGAFLANFSLRASLGYDRGFDDYQTVTATRDDGLAGVRAGNADEVQAKALGWLARGGDAPFFLYLQTMEPHNPYTPPPRFRGKFGGQYGPPEGKALAKFRGKVGAAEIAAGAERISVEDMARQRGKGPEWVEARKGVYSQFVIDALWELDPKRYAECVAYADDAFGRFVAELRRRGLLERTVIILTADHGEALTDGAEGIGRTSLHGFSLHEELVHIPMVIRFPGQAEGHRIDDLVSLTDLAPTILEAVGEPVPDRYRGRSMFAPRPPDNAVFGERFGRGKRIDAYVREGRWKLIGGDQVGYRLFDLRTDPGEHTNVGAARPITLAYLKLRIDELTESMRGRQPPTAVLSEEEREKLDGALRALGYKD